MNINTATDFTADLTPIMDSYQEEHKDRNSPGLNKERKDEWGEKNRKRFTDEFLNSKKRPSITSFQAD